MTDQLPTLAEIGGVETQDVERDGISFASILLSEQRSVEREWISLDHRGKKRVRSQDWKLYTDGRFDNFRSDAGEKLLLKFGELSPQDSDQPVILNRVLEEMAAWCRADACFAVLLRTLLGPSPGSQLAFEPNNYRLMFVNSLTRSVIAISVGSRSIELAP